MSVRPSNAFSVIFHFTSPPPPPPPWTIIRTSPAVCLQRRTSGTPEAQSDNGSDNGLESPNHQQGLSGAGGFDDRGVEGGGGGGGGRGFPEILEQ